MSPGSLHIRFCSDQCLIQGLGLLVHEDLLSGADVREGTHLVKGEETTSMKKLLDWGVIIKVSDGSQNHI